MQRAFPLALVVLAVTSAAHAQTPATPAERAHAIHVLNRLTFGPRPGDVERVLAMGVDRWIEQQLMASGAASYDASYPGCSPWTLPVDSIGEAAATKLYSGATIGFVGRQASLADSYMRVANQRARAYPLFLARVSSPTPRRTESVEIITCRLMRMERSEQQLREVLTDFWLNHFSVYSQLVPDRASLVAYERTIQDHALGSFRTLLGAVAHSPTMLMYLDNHISGAGPGRRSLSDFVRGAPSSYQDGTHLGLNENYGRELLELHTLGVDGGYTQDDVINVARAFTGWSHTAWKQACIETPDVRMCRTTDPRLPLFHFDSTSHDAETKIVLGHTLAAGRGTEDGEQVLDILAAHPSTAKHIARKLAVRFISDAPPQSIVDRAADVFTRTNGDIREVMRTIVASREFHDARGAKAKTPLELILSMRRAFGAPYDTNGEVIEHLIDLEQMPFNHRAPDGWPETAAGWLGPGALVNRVNFARAVAFGEVKGIPIEQWQHWTELTALPYEQQVDRVIGLLLDDYASPQLRNALLAAAPQQPERRGSIAAEVSLRNLISLVLGSPDFQRR
jgi:uncharacterized protein (DUF1800 family)